MSRIFSGIQPSGELHIGNWLGAVRNWVALQDQLRLPLLRSSICTPSPRRTMPARWRERTREMAIGLLAAGIDPSRARSLFVQSHVPEHASCRGCSTTVAPLGELERMTQFKDKSQRVEAVPAGLLSYPVLMAADILLYRADAGAGGRGPGPAPGADPRDRAALERRVRPGEPFFRSRKPLLTPAKRIIGLDGQAKMSKSLGNTIGILETPEEIWEKLRPAMTDPARKTKTGPGNARDLQRLRAASALLAARRRWQRSPSSAAPRAGAASIASGCWPTTWRPRWRRFASAPLALTARPGRGDGHAGRRRATGARPSPRKRCAGHRRRWASFPESRMMPRHRC